ncbi:hypothetical protein DESUT3_19250 [Desulfuromonas versatilis]|uniref:PKD domain-containing protein n=1 Tax=Desulfuromonas versatilis TaxID=2802975 RepID=A0ABN6E130_9BACT|nr:FG-GAP-like repeat-containing protein [Desulfuromonas versatilis]BCR04856.1 hypothetical protein DESUT3_19250 [Desulfuromonas versatilis]
MRHPVSWLLALALCLSVTACGGGGGGSAPPPNPNQLSYSGLTSKATVNADNAEALATGAFLGHQNAMSVGPLAVGGAHSGSSALPLRSVSQLMRRTLRQQAPLAAPRAVTLAPVQEPTEVYHGPCGGQFLSAPVWDPEAGSFADTLEYQDYCEYGMIFSGTVEVAANLDPSTGWFSSFSMTFHPLAILDGDSAYTMDGEINITIGGPQFSETLAMNFLLRDDASNQVFRYENYLSGINYGPEYTEETITGRFYHPAYGYLELSTEQPLQVFWGLLQPSTGSIVCSGRDGTFVRMVFTSLSATHLEADTDGNGICEWQMDLNHPVPLPPVAEPPNQSPTANAGPDQNAVQGDLVTLNGGASFDPDGDQLTFQWNFDACPGSCPTLNNPGTATPSFMASESGTYSLWLIVNDGLLSSAADTVQVTVVPVQPTSPELLDQSWVYGRFGTYIGRSGLSVLDLEGDGNLEIITAASPAGFGVNRYWYVLRHASSGEYAQIHLSEPSQVTINRILARDLDGDGIGEILVGYQDGRIDIFAGDSFTLKNSFQTPGAVTAMTAADLDGDGSAEIVTSDAQRIYVHEAGGTLRWETSGYGGGDLAIGNVDDDPAAEIVVAASGHGYVIDTASHQLEWDYINGFGVRVGTGDTDGDGREEIVAAASWYKITILDAEIKTPKLDIATDLDIGALLVTDLDGDGTAEILYGDSQWGSIDCYEGSGLSERWSIRNPEHGTTGLATGDVDQDGTMEVLWGAGGSSSGADFLFVANTLTGIEWQNVHLDPPLSAVAVGDVDDDGRNEIVMASYESNSGYDDGIISIFDAATHALEWQSSDLPNIYTWSGVNGVRIGDVDHDGETELVVATSHLYDGVVQVYNGRTHALEKQSATYSSEPFTALELADVDGDGATEIVVATNKATTGAVGVHLIVLDGSTLAEKWESASLTDGWVAVSDIETADVDDDGHLEMLVAVGGNRVYAIDGVTHQYDWLAELPASTIGAFDLDADGQKEILVGQTDGTIGVYNGKTFAFQSSVATGSGYAIDALSLADLNGDGQPEWILASNGMLSVLENGSGELLWRSRSLGNRLGSYNHLPVKDIDGDGRKEIVVGSDFALYQFE